MRPILFFSLCLTATALIPRASYAQNACENASSARVSGEIKETCDIHQRRLNYRDNAMEFHSDMQGRREDYIAPQINMKNRYAEQMKAINAARGEDASSNGADDPIDFNDLSDAEAAALLDDDDTLDGMNLNP